MKRPLNCLRVRVIDNFFKKGIVKYVIVFYSRSLQVHRQNSRLLTLIILRYVLLTFQFCNVAKVDKARANVVPLSNRDPTLPLAFEAVISKVCLSSF